MRGLLSPLFIKNMNFKETVQSLLSDALAERPSLFLIDFEITNENKITVTIDGDGGVILQDCIDISRAIEHNIDREEHDFALEVASAGLSTPLKFVRQYKNNIGRTLIVKWNSQIIEATLADANEDFITLTWKTREPKKIGKGKETVLKTQEIPYSEIKEATVTVTF
jgi:ribosome maturation factor RimP